MNYRLDFSFVLLFLSVIVASTFQVNAQRWFAINDSTQYHYQDIHIVAGRNKLYRLNGNEATLLRDFSIDNPQIPEDYVRDFDFLNESTWTVLVGSRYIGNETVLYKTNDSGENWEVITPQSFTVPSNLNGVANHINQIQVLGGRLIAFDGYYNSRVFFSDDSGQTWTHWFESIVWSHYYQIFPCGENLFIMSLEGDGFRYYLVKIPDEYSGQQNLATFNVGNCPNGGLGCYFPPFGLQDPPSVYFYFRDMVQDSICPSLFIEESVHKPVDAYYDTVQQLIVIHGLDTRIPFQIGLYNAFGQCVVLDKNKEMIECASFPAGVYVLRIEQEKEMIVRKIILR